MTGQMSWKAGQVDCRDMTWDVDIDVNPKQTNMTETVFNGRN